MCGATMNCHAEKGVLPLDSQEARRVDPVLCGLVEEFHHCPKCGNSEAREVMESFHV